MNRRSFRNHPEEPEPEAISETRPDSLSDDDDDTKSEAPSRKKRKEMQKRVVTIPIGDVEGSKGKGETYPPSDSWAWRKYGQKPIKGSPYPRGYYRCSSSKGCPAKKQVERSRVDPTMLIVTYSYEHNHSFPVKKSHSSAPTTVSVEEVATPTSSTDGTATTSTTDADTASRIPPEELTIFASHSDLELVGDAAILLTDHHAWFDDVASTRMLESPICGQVEDVALTMREEDESLFGDLDELPESSTVFQRRSILRSSAFQCGGITGQQAESLDLFLSPTPRNDK